MAYKYQNEIEDAVDVMVKVMGRDKHSKAQQELAEVYRKAEAFDEMRETTSVVLDDIYEREITHADLGYQAIGRELTVIMDNLEKED